MSYRTCQAVGCEREGDWRVRAGARWLNLCDKHRWEYVNPGCQTPEIKGDGDGEDSVAGDAPAAVPAVPVVEPGAARRGKAQV